MNQFIYDPNDAVSMRHCHRVRIKVQAWEYTREYETLVGGNVRGFRIFKAAIENVVCQIIDEIYPHGDFNAEHRLIVILESESGGTLEVDLNETEDVVQEFKDMVVAVEIIGIEKREDD